MAHRQEVLRHVGAASPQTKLDKRAVVTKLIVFFLSATIAVAAQAPAIPGPIPVSGDTEFVHDPSLIKDGETWYLFSTSTGPNQDGEIPLRCSKDLHVWKTCGSVLRRIPDWIARNSPLTKNLWAPDISFFNGEYHLYYAFSVFGKNTSGIALLTNRTLDPTNWKFHWKDHGLVLKSQEQDRFNAIDPNLVI